MTVVTCWCRICRANNRAKDITGYCQHVTTHSALCTTTCRWWEFKTEQKQNNKKINQKSVKQNLNWSWHCVTSCINFLIPVAVRKSMYFSFQVIVHVSAFSWRVVTIRVLACSDTFLNELNYFLTDFYDVYLEWQQQFMGFCSLRQMRLIKLQSLHRSLSTVLCHWSTRWMIYFDVSCNRLSWTVRHAFLTCPCLTAVNSELIIIYSQRWDLDLLHNLWGSVFLFVVYRLLAFISKWRIEDIVIIFYYFSEVSYGRYYYKYSAQLLRLKGI